jgi:predicted DNA-binding protein (UPF0251 family)
MRPKKTRWVKCDSSERCFNPQTKSKSLGEIVLSLDEFEAVRLLDHEGISQTKAAQMMRVHRSTVSRIVSSARQKIAQALVDIKTLKIEGGCCKIQGG